ncbi:MAG: dTMP kinase [Candidatus Thorarchaeota archaeon]|nr:dTMP kinase [Candidatus Thorarchaeota archaeon]
MNFDLGRTGYLFVVEGIDGSGKTTVCLMVVEALRKEGVHVIHLREPTSESKWGQEIRLRSPKGELTPDEELTLFIKDREWNAKNRISPALAEGKVVIMDRYFFATGAYQTTSTGIPWEDILKRNREEIHAPEPDMVFILDVSVEIGLRRIGGREEDLNQQFEQYDRLLRVRQAYLEMVERDTGNLVLVDASRDLEVVYFDVLQQIIRYIGNEKHLERGKN